VEPNKEPIIESEPSKEQKETIQLYLKLAEKNPDKAPSLTVMGRKLGVTKHAIYSRIKTLLANQIWEPRYETKTVQVGYQFTERGRQWWERVKR